MPAPLATNVTSAVSPAVAAAPSGKAAASSFDLSSQAGLQALITLVGLTALTIFAYWQVMEEVAISWSQPQYSHGWIIPLIGLYMLWACRPNQNVSAEASRGLLEKANQAMIPCLAVAGVGKFMMHSTLVAGLGLSAACLVALAAGLLGQPYATPTFAGRDERGTSLILWPGIAVATVLVLVSIGTQPLGYTLPVFHAGYYQMFALLLLSAVGVFAAYHASSDSSIGPAEVIFGFALVGLSIASWIYSTGLDMLPLKRMTYVTTLLGLFSMVGGLRLLRWTGPAVVFLLFMFPLPTLFEQFLLRKLQWLAVRGSEVIFTLLGCSVLRYGSKLEVEGIPMEVIEACSGLSMSTILIAMAFAMVVLIKRPWWDKLIVLLSAIPIALAANVFRIIATGLLWIVMDKLVPMSPEAAAGFRDAVHDFAGITFTMPFALGLYWLEFKLLSLLTVEDEGIEARGAAVLGASRATPAGGGAPVVR